MGPLPMNCQWNPGHQRIETTSRRHATRYPTRMNAVHGHERTHPATPLDGLEVFTVANELWDALVAAVREGRDRETLAKFAKGFGYPRCRWFTFNKVAAELGYEPDGKGGWNKHG